VYIRPARKATLERKADHLEKLIAAQATSLNATLLTNTERLFIGYPLLHIENW
jgi:tRNA(fMet)-specific endonuclease VapC